MLLVVKNLGYSVKEPYRAEGVAKKVIRGGVSREP